MTTIVIKFLLTNDNPLVLNALGKFIQRFKGAKFGWNSRCRQSGMHMLPTAPEAVNTTAPGATGNNNSATSIFSVWYISYVFLCFIIFNAEINAGLKCLRALWHFVLNIYSILLLRFYVTYMRRRKYICMWVLIYSCLGAYTYVFAYGYWDIDTRIYVFVSVSMSLPFFLFNYSSVPSLYHLHYSLCFALLYTLMLYICDRSTPDLNKEDELYELLISLQSKELMSFDLCINCCNWIWYHQHYLCRSMFFHFTCMFILSWQNNQWDKPPDWSAELARDITCYHSYTVL